MYLVDTNVLIRTIQSDSPEQEIAIEACAILLEQGIALGVVPQNMAEFWGVCTRPQDCNGLGLSIEETREEIEEIEEKFTLYFDKHNLYDTWKQLVTDYNVRGVKVHDTRLVAAMLVHNLTHILTFNVSDFKRFREIITVHPTDI